MSTLRLATQDQELKSVGEEARVVDSELHKSQVKEVLTERLRGLPALSWEGRAGGITPDHLNSLCYYNWISLPGLRSASSWL